METYDYCKLNHSFIYLDMINSYFNWLNFFFVHSCWLKKMVKNRQAASMLVMARLFRDMRNQVFNLTIFECTPSYFLYLCYLCNVVFQHFYMV